MDSLMRTALAAQDMFPVIRLIEELETALTQSQAELAEVIAIRELAIQFYILGNPEKLIEYITENIDLGKYLEATHE